MKTTSERLVNSYCIPKSHEDWDAIYPQAKWLSQYPSSHSHVFYVDGGKYLASYPNENPNRTEIPIQHFIDLIEDKICEWRLAEDGFVESIWQNNHIHTLKLSETKEVLFNYDGTCQVWQIQTIDEITEWNKVDFENVKTYSDLLTLIRLL